MGDLSKHFSRHEFKCKGHPDCYAASATVDIELIRVLEDLRTRYERPVSINSGHRCRYHNESVGGAENSQHLYAKAADVVIDGITPQTVYEYLNNRYPDKYGIGLYEDFTHIDVRPWKARW